MRKMFVLLAMALMLVFGLNGCAVRATVPTPEVEMVVPEPPDVNLGVGAIGPPVSAEVYYGGPFVIAGVPYWYYGGGFFILEGGFYHFHHMCPFGERGFYHNHWRNGYHNHYRGYHHGHPGHPGHGYRGHPGGRPGHPGHPGGRSGHPRTHHPH